MLKNLVNNLPDSKSVKRLITLKEIEKNNTE